MNIRLKCLSVFNIITLCYFWGRFKMQSAAVIVSASFREPGRWGKESFMERNWMPAELACTRGFGFFSSLVGLQVFPQDGAQMLPWFYLKAFKRSSGNSIFKLRYKRSKSYISGITALQDTVSKAHSASQVRGLKAHSPFPEF